MKSLLIVSLLLSSCATIFPGEALPECSTGPTREACLNDQLKKWHKRALESEKQMYGKLITMLVVGGLIGASFAAVIVREQSGPEPRR